ncbi:MAG: peptidoglycan-binding protein [Clostridia bacterium]|nr:peptidoglycan-binding protein [Clostridia bacterium]
MYGSDVKAIQERLKILGFFNSIPNGKFGVETENAIQEYCKANGLYIRKTISIDLQKRMGFNLID